MCRKYGKDPYDVAVVHGGPGAPGEMASVAQELSTVRGVIEPLQAADSLDGQVEELRNKLEQNSSQPLTLVGWSWGAMLSFVLTACFPEKVKKLILVSSGVFEEKYAENIMSTRKSRLGYDEQEMMDTLLFLLSDPDVPDKNTVFAQLGELINQADSFDPIPSKNSIIEYQYDLHCKVWNDVKAFRKSGGFAQLGQFIKCPVVVIHGDYDPHPLEGIEKPLSSILSDLKMVTLKNCGHRPWLEKQAKDAFYEVLKSEL